MTLRIVPLALPKEPSGLLYIASSTCSPFGPVMNCGSAKSSGEPGRNGLT
jgi:hypothetical protein